MSNGPVWLTGGTGYLGSHVREQLTDEGTSVTLLVRPETAVSPAPNETVTRGDITESLPPIDETVETVLHLAAQTSVSRAIDDPVTTWDVNATGTRNVLEAVRDADVSRLLYASTASVYGPPEYLPIDESHPLEPVEPYGTSKLAGDRLVRAYERTYGLESVTVRIFNTYGPGQPDHNVVPAIVSQALDGGPVELGNLSPSRDFLFIDDVVDAVRTVWMQGTSGEVYNVGSGADVTIETLANTAVDLIDPDIAINSKTDRQRSDDVEIPRHVADNSKISQLGWEPTYDLESGLKETIASYDVG